MYVRMHISVYFLYLSKHLSINSSYVGSVSKSFTLVRTICMHVSMYVCMYVRMYVCMYVCGMHVCNACIYVCMHAIYLSMYQRIHLHYLGFKLYRIAFVYFSHKLPYNGNIS